MAMQATPVFFPVIQSVKTTFEPHIQDGAKILLDS
eukprot:COSAG01_NODE_30853_length_608_cov_1.090373_2_plen_35_part_01